MRTNTNILRWFLLPAVLFSLAAAARDDASAYLKSLLDSGRVTAVYTYDVDGSVPVNGCGMAVLEGNCFRLSSGSLQILCDGSAIYTVDASSKEVYIESVGNAGKLLKDPQRLLSGIKDLKVSGTTVSGTLPDAQNGSTLHFILSEITTGAPAGSKDEFRFDSASATPEWVITDLR